MGGTPWHSKGCMTCRKRKVKCDEQEPECARCVKRGVKCPGYEKTRIFVHHPSARRETARVIVPITESQYQVEYQSPYQAHIQNQYPAQCQDPARAFVMPSNVTSGPVAREQVFSSFTNVFFSHTEEISSLNLWQYLIYNFATLPNKTNMLERAISAVSCLYMGKMNNDDHMYNYGLDLYGTAIRSVKNNIYRNAWNAEIVYTAVIFQELEGYCCAFDLRAWLAHTQGTSTLLRYYRDLLPRNPLLDAIYNQHQKMRLIIATSGLNTTEDEYQYAKQSSGGISTPLSELLAVYAEFGPLSTVLNTISANDHEGCETLLQNCFKQKTRITAWFSQYGYARGLIVCAPDECKTDELPPTEDLFGAGYRFSTLDNARMHHWYWNALATIQPMIYKAKSLVRSHPLTPESDSGKVPARDEDHRLSEYYADEICRTIPYYANDTKTLCGIRMLMFPLSGAIKVYIGLGHREKFLWCQHALRLISNRGLSSSRRLSEMYWNNWNHRTNELWPVPCRSLRDEMLSFELSTKHKEEVFDVGQTLEESRKNEAARSIPVLKSSKVVKPAETHQADKVPNPREKPRPREEPKTKDKEQPPVQSQIRFIQEVIRV
ncbi:uncharacterized protein N7458_010344 [Penicillium daleae]|uniref:Zn(2)-C6 fungal-type domain-containing protein n=1 Tax=Penicillium daleae TaxID=63821 RepID=A0AAD6FZY9_9EURO|nr:uncharacterized protein N7458_010344 [Penicillium daleae]KAJ5439346.1 hypothetical protein N7458_010344 [Penicillium daleae]